MPSPHLAEEMYDAWARVTNPSRVLEDILEDQKKSRTLYNMIRRQAKFIEAERSKDFDLGEITIFDKVLVDLWREGHQLKNIGLLEFFIEEYMMAKTVRGYREKKVIVYAYLRAQEMIDADAEVKAEGFTAQQASPLDKLIRVYQDAKADFYFSDANKSGVSNKCNDKFNNVRFLRDTAENLYRHMKANNLESHPLLPEVTKTVNVSQQHAEHLAGGRKRIFELNPNEDTRPRGPRFKRQRREREHHGREHPGRRPDRYVDSYRPQRPDRVNRDGCRDDDEPNEYHDGPRDDLGGPPRGHHRNEHDEEYADDPAHN
ncbi:uncharacterized protein N7482_006769 [Penicillium canariense]|uniref:Uncharacterized protein n=1 Tax=Penicillium canariense TaxID=189055 RepID=A0A9W9HXY6_9EURO|nr:uncharacterized protein N7482_006769 [Penicillium canariense]KAJ5159765.1 hypothetical protein N7482_006769 [Penicillium canariense]